MKGTATSTAMRLVRLLERVPRQSRRSVADLQHQLESLGFRVTTRMVQRDLEKLATEGLVHSDQQRPAGWVRTGEGGDLGLSTSDPAIALALAVLQKQARHLLPPSVAELLQPRFEAAQRTLSSRGDAAISQWMQRIAVSSRAQPLIPPSLSPAIQRTVFDALLQRRRMSVTYAARGSDRPKSYEVHPQALIAKDGMYVLIVLVGSYEDPRELLLHRLKAAQMLEARCRESPDFDVQRYVQNGGTNFATGSLVRLQATFDGEAGPLFTEYRLAEDQVVTMRELKNGERRYDVAATVPDSLRLQSFLLSFGDALIGWRKRPVPSPRSRD